MSYKQILQQRAKKNNAVKLINSLHVSNVILSPALTEKSMKMAEGHPISEKKTYTFYVDTRASKNDVKVACSTMFKVDAEDIRTVSLPAKKRNQRKMVRHALKKAYITLPK
jgi:ribosomal protein L23